MTEKSDTETIPGLFFANVQKYHDKPAFILYQEGGRRTIAYGEIITEVRRLASSLFSIVNRGDRVSIFSENRPEWCIAYLAIMALGGIAVPVDSELGKDEYTRIALDSGAVIIFCSRKTIDKIDSPRLPGVEIVNFDDHSCARVKARNVPAFQPRQVSPEDLASIIYTSGTTGVPKGVMLSHKNFCSDVDAIVRTGILEKHDNVLGVLPLHHTYAFMCTFLVPFLLGGVVTYPLSLKGPDLAHAIKDSGVTILIGVPQLLDLFYSSIRRNMAGLPFLRRLLANTFLDLGRFFRGQFDLNIGRILFRSVHRKFGIQFRFMASGGARLSPETMKGLEAIGFTVLEGYGLTETSPVVTFNPIGKRKAGSVGKPLEGVEIKIDREEGSPEKEGEILVRGDMVFRGYYHMPEETEKMLMNGWFHSGDLGYRDNEGYLFITGRKKELIVLSSGKNIYPEEVEKEYQRIPLIKEIGVYEKEEGGTVTLHGLVVPNFDYAKEQKIANLHEALKWNIHRVSLRMPPWMRLRGFTLYREPLPRTRLGKLRRFQLKSLVEEAGPGGTQKQPATQELDPAAEKVMGVVGSVLVGKKTLSLSDNLELDLGVDSLKRVELLVELENAFSLSLPEAFMLEVQTVADIAGKIRELQESSKERKPGGEKTFRDMLFKSPEKEQIEAIGLKQGKLTALFVRVLLRVIRWIFKVYFRPEVKGLENIPNAPFMLLSNHASYLDSFLIASHLPYAVFEKLFFQGAREYFESKPMRWFAKVAHVIPIDPDSHLTSALSLSAFVLRENNSLCIFPEGGRSMDGSIMPFRKGIGILSSELHIPLVPVRLSGTYESMPRGSRFPKRKKLGISIGPPITTKEVERMTLQGGDFYRAIADLARERVLALGEEKDR